MWRIYKSMKAIKHLFTQVPDCLIKVISQVTSITFSVLFSLVFLSVYTPFSTTSWFQVGLSDRFVWTIVFVGISTLFLTCSRLIMNFAVRRLNKFSLLVYLIWLLVEIILIGAFHALMSLTLIRLTGFSFGFIFLKSLLITLLALGTPYLITILAILLQDTRQRLSITNSDIIESDSETLPEHTKIINITDNNGNLKLSVKLDNIFYIKSEDNYINVFYLKKGKVSSYLLRSKLQTIENNLPSCGPLIRCHRSYIVNINNISLLQNDSDGFIIDFNREDLDSIPVSKTYSAKIVEAFSQQ